MASSMMMTGVTRFSRTRRCDFVLDGTEVFHFPVGGLYAQFHGQVPVEFHDGEGGQAGINHFIKGRVQLRGPAADGGRFATPGTAGKQPESPGGKQVVQTETEFLKFLGFYKDIFLNF